MTAHESKRLVLGDRVYWNDDPKDQGTVIEHDYIAVKVQWDSGEVGITHHDDGERLTRV